MNAEGWFGAGFGVCFGLVVILAVVVDVVFALSQIPTISERVLTASTNQPLVAVLIGLMIGGVVGVLVGHLFFPQKG